MRRLLLVTLGLAALAAGCGSNADRAGSGAPTPADLAGDATQALFEEGSAHYVLDGSIEAENEDDMDFPTPITVHLEGDYSAEAMTAEGNVSFPGGNFTGGLIVGPHEFFINVLGRWFGTKEYGIVDAERELGKDDPRAAELYRDLQTGDGVRRYFDRVFVGEVGEGPETDGDATWAFEGHLNADGIAGLAAEFGEEEPTGPELEAFRQIADNVRVTLVVGRDDSLPRRFDLDVELTPEDFAALEKADSGFDEHGTVRMDFALVLSDFGKDVEYEAPEKFEPLEKAFEAFFSGMG